MTKADKLEVQNLRRQNAQLSAKIQEQSDVIHHLLQQQVERENTTTCSNVVAFPSTQTSDNPEDVIEPFITAMVNKYNINQYQCAFLRSFITSFVETD